MNVAERGIFLSEM